MSCFAHAPHSARGTAPVRTNVAVLRLQTAHDTPPRFTRCSSAIDAVTRLGGLSMSVVAFSITAVTLSPRRLFSRHRLVESPLPFLAKRHRTREFANSTKRRGLTVRTRRVRLQAPRHFVVQGARPVERDTDGVTPGQPFAFKAALTLFLVMPPAFTRLGKVVADFVDTARVVDFSVVNRKDRVLSARTGESRTAFGRVEQQFNAVGIREQLQVGQQCLIALWCV
jgi:hypothetical protein